ncbi:MAG: hypothetical protein ICV60_07860 [Pyrinomonadaceae bacterium]|nr:hypothetical protein [Pyrinomonadaceae bacterium]
MRLWGLLAGALLLLAAAMIAGCNRNSNLPAGAGAANAPGTARNISPDNVKRVTVGELRDMLEQNKAVIVDVRGTDAYKPEHIKGALDIPEKELSARAGELPKDKLIVLYCS